VHVRGLYRRLKTWCRAKMTEDRLCGLEMLHVHRNDTVGQIDPDAVLKRWNSSGNSKSILHSLTKYT
jgi:hypothetical protein